MCKPFATYRVALQPIMSGFERLRVGGTSFDSDDDDDDDLKSVRSPEI